MKWLLLLGILPLIGAGCARSVAPPTAETRYTPPRLDILSPRTRSTIASTTVEIVGQTNMATVIVNGMPYPVTVTPFHIERPLHDGLNALDISVGDGLTTTTVPLVLFSSSSSL